MLGNRYYFDSKKITRDLKSLVKVPKSMQQKTVIKVPLGLHPPGAKALNKVFDYRKTRLDVGKWRSFKAQSSL